MELGLDALEVSQLKSLRMFCSDDLSVPLMYRSCCLAPGFAQASILGFPKMHPSLLESKYDHLLFFLSLYGKQRVGSEVIREDWRRRAIH